MYLENFSQEQRNTILSGFAHAVRIGTFSKGSGKQLVEGTVTTTVAHVAQAFRANNRKDPRLDFDGKTCFMLQEQYRGYRNTDGSKKKQKALPLSAIRKIMDTAVTHKDLALAWLFIGATFFTMRSCEYLKTNHNEDSKRTKIIRLRNIRFKKNGRMLDMGKDKLTEADLVAITFEFQKNDKRDKTVHMFTTNYGIMCPVVAWASTVK